MLGYAYQIGALPLSAEAIERAIELNGEAVAMNIAAFRWGRRAALDLAAVEKLRRADGARSGARSSRSPSTRWSRAASPSSPTIRMPPMRRATAPGSTRRAPPRPGARRRQVRARRGGRALSVQADGLQGRVRGRAALHRRHRSRAGQEHLRRRRSAASSSSRARRCSRRTDKAGRPRKMTFGPWMFGAVPGAGEAQGPARHGVRHLRLYARSARPSAQLIADYEAMLAEVLAELTPDNHHLAVGLAAIPEKIRGFGHVKMRTSLPPRPTKRRCSSNSAPVRRRCSRRRSNPTHAIRVDARGVFAAAENRKSRRSRYSHGGPHLW